MPLSKNQSHFGGGAISASQSKLIVKNSTFVDNEVGHNGGAISLWRSTSEISNSSFIGNSARTYNGGAIYVGPGVTADINNSTFVGNRATHGSAVATNAGEIYESFPSETTLTHVTIVDRREAGKGLGFNIWVDENDENFKLRNSLIIGMKSPYRKESSSCHGPLNENIGNFIEDGSCESKAGGDPMLAEMTGRLAHFPLRDGSPALDAADARFCTETDQLGRVRPQGGGCDIGAIEAMPVAEARSDCVVTTTQELNLRDGPNGNRIGVLPRSTAVVAEARTARWFNVEYQSRTGWIRAEHVLTRGVCG